MKLMPAAAVLGVAAALAGGVCAQPQPDAGEVHGLRLGLRAQAMPLDGWGQLACGGDGGPPRQELESWSEFKTCRPEASGLHEVAARFDDEDEYVAKALGEASYAAQSTGTRVAGHPVLLSALFDDDGMLRGIRMVSDPRAAPGERRMAHLLGVAVINRYGSEGWRCADQPPAEGETAVGGVFIKQLCEKATPARILTVETHFLRKPGQRDVDPGTHDYTQGAYESWARFELFEPGYRKP